MSTCTRCGTSRLPVSGALGVCGPCLADPAADPMPAHAAIRKRYGLPAVPPRSPDGIPCTLCMNHCRLAEDEPSYCGVRVNKGGCLTGGEDRADLDAYFDPVPTNCVGSPWCRVEGGTTS